MDVMDAGGHKVALTEELTQTRRKIGADYDTPRSNRVLVGKGLGTAGWKRLPPAGNAASRYVECVCFGFTTNVTTGDGAFYFHVPKELSGMILTYVHALVITAGTTGTTDIQIANVTDSVDMLSTKITIDSTETGSNTAATAAVIDITKDDVALNDVLRIDVDAVSTTKPKGLIVTMGFRLP